MSFEICLKDFLVKKIMSKLTDGKTLGLSNFSGSSVCEQL